MVLWVFYAFVRADHFAKDFPQFYALGRLVVEHRPDDLQNGAALSLEVAEHVSPTIQWILLPIYGPQVALLFAPFAALHYRTAEFCWLTVSALLYGFAVWRLYRDCLHLRSHAVTTGLLALAAPAFFELIWYGQMSMVALVMTVVGFSALERNWNFSAGLAFGMLAYKPQYGVALGIILGMARAYRVIGGALVTGLGQLAVAALYGGAPLLVRYFHTLLAAPSQLNVLQSNRHLMQSLLSVSEWLPGRTLPVAAYAAVSLAAVVATYVVWSRSASAQLRQSALVLCGLLISPHLYVYDLVLLTPVFFWLADWMLNPEQRGRDFVRRGLMWCLTALYFWPVAGLTLTYYIGFNFGPLLMLGALGLVVAGEFAKVRTTVTPKPTSATETEYQSILGR